MTGPSLPRIDHLVFTAGSLAAGRDWMSDRLARPPCGGGQHPQMGTHNALWRIGDHYLEVIAIDPDAPPPGRPRWFALDELDTDAPVRLATWVAEVPDPVNGPEAQALGHWPVLDLHRGDLNWRLTVPDDGQMRASGAAPYLISWPEDAARPGLSLPDQGLALDRLELDGPPPFCECLHASGLDRLVALSEAPRPKLTARLSEGRTGAVFIFES
ncbi:VOC family protein [Oceanomicrobium pacificus]|uniref:VOC family protein n=1 Tax=Oceanomicrobium pacificus TaxID=2692916 RepID=A0A6B0TI69_9RHOB|nr:VOC family protein [Oceanomicrobium pacificus]MXU64057.1 VOC family protein [Oceanomicrobium pacificus]